MENGRLAACVLRDAVVAPGDVRPREGRAWLVDWRGRRCVLRRAPAPPDPDALGGLTKDLVWLHAFLDWLAATGFPAPQPLRAFDGRSWTVAEGALWQLVSFLPGKVVGWADQPPIEEIGALLARYHLAARHFDASAQRPGALPMASVPTVLSRSRLQAASLDPGAAAVIGQLAERLARDLTDAGGTARAPIVVHGDFTSHNVLADGAPPRLTGVIDFAGAHVETPLADIRAGRAEIGMLAQVLWLSANAASLADACTASLA
jgi:Ser/Thr protein kinase RdoA (MazF antagonist)